MNDIRMSKKQKCCICGSSFYGYGNNPAPVRQYGKCCNDCNTEKVIPARIVRMNLGLDPRG